MHAIPPRLPVAEETGNWAIDNHTGREHAGELIAYVRKTGNPLPLCRAIGEIVRRGQYGAVEIGFIYKVVVSTM